MWPFSALGCDLSCLLSSWITLATAQVLKVNMRRDILALACLGVCFAASGAAAASNDAPSHNGILRKLAEADSANKSSSTGYGSDGDGSSSKPRKYKLVVTAGNKAPDCVNRKVILVNGDFQPRLTFTQGDWVEVSSWPACCICS